MTHKFVAIAVAVLVNCVVLACFHLEGTPMGASAAAAQPTLERTLPTVTVRPTRAQIEMLRHVSMPIPADSAASSVQTGVQSPSRAG